MSSLQIIYASTSAHTEYVVERLTERLAAAGKKVEVTRAEKAAAEDFARGDVLVLASSTWNTGNVEGQLNPHMFALLTDRAKDVQLGGKKTAVIALGDQRYHYKANAAVHLEEFVNKHGGELVVPTLKILNEPFGQEAVIDRWGRELLEVQSNELRITNHELPQKGQIHNS